MPKSHCNFQVQCSVQYFHLISRKYFDGYSGLTYLLFEPEKNLTKHKTTWIHFLCPCHALMTFFSGLIKYIRLTLTKSKSFIKRINLNLSLNEPPSIIFINVRGNLLFLHLIAPFSHNLIWPATALPHQDSADWYCVSDNLKFHLNPVPLSKNT